MFRSVQNDLISWKNDPYRKPLLIRGARQVGKSYIVEAIGKAHFQNIITINFEFEPRFKGCFQSLDPLKIVNNLEAMVGQKIIPGYTLLFLDEIQQCPEAILALRYFKEKLPELHVIAAGSLLEFALNTGEFSEPVGRVQSLYMHPCTFKEFLIADNQQLLLQRIAEATPLRGLEPPLHTLLLEKCREYFVLGGMPEVVRYFVEQKKYHGCEVIQATILEYYQRDFPKYGKKVNFINLQKIFSRAPALVAKHFKFSEIDQDIQARDQKPALQALFNAGILYPVYHTAASGLPLNASLNEKKFKLLFLDIGLFQHASRMDIETLLMVDLNQINQGALAEQFVGQELIALSKNFERPELYFWERNKKGSQAEVDYVVNWAGQIFPIEVKSGTIGRLRSCRLFMQEKNISVGIRISSLPLSWHEGILSVPFYMVHELPRLIRQL